MRRGVWGGWLISPILFASVTTIFAQGTGASRGAIAILRMTGPGVRDALRNVAGGCARCAARKSAGAARGRWGDVGIGAWSCTGQARTATRVRIAPNCMSMVGPRSLRQSVPRCLKRASRPAEAGEFSRRAFLNGRMDLLEAEGCGRSGGG